MKLNPLQDYNVRNFGIVKLKIKFPDYTEDEIYKKLFYPKLRRPRD